MPRPRKSVPSYSLHKPTNRAYVRLPDGAGGRKTVYLPGTFGSTDSKAEYARLVAELVAAPLPVALPTNATLDNVTVNDVLLGFFTHALKHYRRADGTPTNEIAQYRQTFRLVRELYGPTPAAAFGPMALKSLRQQMIARRWTRKLINQRVGRVRRAFKWAVENEVLPPAVHLALTAVPGLQAGRTEAKETAPVEPVADEIVQATLPFVRPEVAAMIRVQLLSGMRPGEVCGLRPADVDTSKPVWVYTPPQHKTAWRGKRRAVANGPKAQAVLKTFWPTDANDFVFSPRRAVVALHASRTATRKPPRYPSGWKRNQRVKSPKRKPAEIYTVSSYGQAIGRACDKAFPAPSPLGQEIGETLKAWLARLTPQQREALVAWQTARRWHPNQLRHAHGTLVRRRFGLEAAQVVLGHERADVTQVYAEANLGLAIQVAAEVG